MITLRSLEKFNRGGQESGDGNIDESGVVHLRCGIQCGDLTLWCLECFK